MSSNKSDPVIVFVRYKFLLCWILIENVLNEQFLLLNNN